MTTPLLLIALSYLAGAVPMGLLIGKWFGGIDVRKSGSANIGATNVSRLLGKKIGFFTLLADALKGVLPMALAAWLLGEHPYRESVILLCGAAAFLGHLYPIYLRFQGGKGVATALGVFLYLNPLAVLPAFLIFVVVVARWRYVSAGSLAASAIMPVVLFWLDAAGQEVLLAAGIAGLIWLRHRANLDRLLRGKESKWGTPSAEKQRSTQSPERNNG